MNEGSQKISPQHETRDINARAIGCSAIALIAGVVVIYVALVGLFAQFNERHPGTAANRITTASGSRPEPHLQSDPASEMERFRQREDEILNGYAWVDRGAGVARIPIERAMDIIAQRGLPMGQGNDKTSIEMRQEKTNAKEQSP